MRGISRRTALAAGAAALAGTALTGTVAFASESGGQNAITASAKPLQAATTLALDGTATFEGLTVSVPAAWAQSPQADGAGITVSSETGDSLDIALLDAKVAGTDEESKANSLAGAFGAYLAQLDAFDLERAPHFLSAVTRQDADPVVAGSATLVCWDQNGMRTGRVCVAGDGTATYVLSCSVDVADEKGPEFLATVDAIWASKSIASQAAAGGAGAGAAGGASGATDEFAVSIDSCVPMTDYDGAQAAVFTFTFTNNSQETTSFASEFLIEVYQDGVQQDMAFVTDVDTGGYLDKVRPGATLSFQLAYEAPTASPVEIEVSTFDFLNDEIVASATFPLA